MKSDFNPNCRFCKCTLLASITRDKGVYYQLCRLLLACRQLWNAGHTTDGCCCTGGGDTRDKGMCNLKPIDCWQSNRWAHTDQVTIQFGNQKCLTWNLLGYPKKGGNLECPVLGGLLRACLPQPSLSSVTQRHISRFSIKVYSSI